MKQITKDERSIISFFYFMVLFISILFNLIQCDARKQQLTIHDVALMDDIAKELMYNARLLELATQETMNQCYKLESQINLERSAYFEMGKRIKTSKVIQGKKVKVIGESIKKGIKELNKKHDRFKLW